MRSFKGTQQTPPLPQALEESRMSIHRQESSIAAISVTFRNRKIRNIGHFQEQEKLEKIKIKQGPWQDAHMYVHRECIFLILPCWHLHNRQSKRRQKTFQSCSDQIVYFRRFWGIFLLRRDVEQSFYTRLEPSMP